MYAALNIAWLYDNAFKFLCISYITGKSALPDTYIRTTAQGGAAHKEECRYIRQSTLATVNHPSVMPILKISFSACTRVSL